MINRKKGTILVLELTDTDYDIWRGSITCPNNKTTMHFEGVLEMLKVIDISVNTKKKLIAEINRLSKTDN